MKTSTVLLTLGAIVGLSLIAMNLAAKNKQADSDITPEASDNSGQGQIIKPSQGPVLSLKPVDLTQVNYDKNAGTTSMAFSGSTKPAITLSNILSK